LKNNHGIDIIDFKKKELEMAKAEPILSENKNRFVLFPIQHEDIWSFYKKADKIE
jgi:hypothetical protein